MEIKIEEKNTLWKFVITDPLLLNKNGSLKVKVKQLANKIDKMDMDWDLIIYKDLVAFKLPPERKTFIYSKKYWDSRCDKCLNSLKTIELKEV